MTHDPDCIFCKIVAGSLPAEIVWKSDAIVAFLDIRPLAAGHLVVVCRDHHVTLDEMPADAAAALGASLPALVAAVRRLPGVSGVNILQNNGQAAGQQVGHVHVHVIPRTENDGLGYRWNATEYGTGQAAEMREQLVRLLARD